jgi:hypothetical protein
VRLGYIPAMAKITIFKSSKPQAEEYENAHDVSIENGVLTFYYEPDTSSLGGKKITTSVPFFIEEEIGGV